MGQKGSMCFFLCWSQLCILESFFHRQKYPSLPEAEMLSWMTGLTYQQIRVWFQNRRGKHRRLCAGDGTPGSSLSALQVQPLEYLEPCADYTLFSSGALVATAPRQLPVPTPR